MCTAASSPSPIFRDFEDDFGPFPIVIPREGGVSSKLGLCDLSLAFWNTGSPAFAGDDGKERI
jgi:hypothetical protein